MSLKWKPHTFLAPLYFPRKKKKTFPEKRKKIFLNLKFLFLSPPLPPHFNSDQKNLTSALSLSLSLSLSLCLIFDWDLIRNFREFFFSLRDLLWLTRRTMVKITWTNMTARNTKTRRRRRCLKRIKRSLMGLVKWAWRIHIHGPIKGKPNSCKGPLWIDTMRNLDGIPM